MTTLRTYLELCHALSQYHSTVVMVSCITVPRLYIKEIQQPSRLSILLLDPFLS